MTVRGGAGVLKRIAARGGGAWARTARWASGTAASTVIYETPLGAAVRTLKRVSMTSAGLALAPVCFIVASDGDFGATQAAVTAGSLVVSFASSAGVHYLFAPYVLTLRRLENEDLEATTMNLFGWDVRTRFAATEAAPVPPGARRPFVAFFARQKPLYVHTTVFKDKVLLEALVGRGLTEAEKKK